MTTITTDRLLLRLPVATDFDAIARIWAEPAVVKYIGGKPFTREQSWQRLLRYVGHWTLFGYGTFAVIDRATGELVGDVGISNFERGLTPSSGRYEAGWVLDPSTHGRGLASEALGAALAWFDAKFPAQPTRCIINAENLPSQRVAAKSGYREVARTTYHDSPILMFERPAPTS